MDAAILRYAGLDRSKLPFKLKYANILTFDKRIVNVADLPEPVVFNEPFPQGGPSDITVTWVQDNWPGELPFVWLFRLGSDEECRHFFQPGECEGFEFAASALSLIPKWATLSWSICLSYLIPEVRNMADKTMGGFWLIVRRATQVEREAIDFIRRQTNLEVVKLLAALLLASTTFASWRKQTPNAEPAQIQKRWRGWIESSWKALQQGAAALGPVSWIRELCHPIRAVQRELAIEEIP